jgi:FkbM family methyltransferase
MISYAQNREDVLLRRLFRDVSEGFYIDVGANDPVELSVTKHFYDRGWRGINVEPLPDAYRRLRAERPRDVNLRIGVGRAEGKLPFFEVAEQDVLSTFCKKQADAYRDEGLAVVERAVPVRTLASVCAEHVGDQLVHFLSVDVEGFEREVLEGADWRRWRPQAVLVEATKPNSTLPSHHDWERVLLEAGYLFAYFDGLNRFYVRSEDAHLLEHFRVPVNITDDFVWHPYQREVDEMRGHAQAAQARADRLERDLKQASADLEQAGLAVRDVQGRLEANQAHLGAAQAHLSAAQDQLLATQGQLLATQSQVTATQSQLTATQSQLCATQAHLCAAQGRSVALERQLSEKEALLSEREALHRQTGEELERVWRDREALTRAHLALQAEHARTQEALLREQVRIVPRLRLLARRVARKLAPEGSALRSLLKRGRHDTPGRNGTPGRAA